MVHHEVIQPTSSAVSQAIRTQESTLTYWYHYVLLTLTAVSLASTDVQQSTPKFCLKVNTYKNT